MTQGVQRRVMSDGDDAAPVEDPLDDAAPAGDTTDDGAPAGDAADSPRDSCPSCGEPVPAEARFCPHCATAIDADGDAVDLSDMDADGLPADPAELLSEDDGGTRRAAGRVRVLAGLAVSVPLAPLVLFLVGSVVSLTVWTGSLVFLGGWLLPAAALSRARVPAEAFGWSLYLVAACTLLVPLAVRAGGFAARGGESALSFDVVALVSIVVAGVAVLLATFVTRQARRRVSGDRRAFEELREE